MSSLSAQNHVTAPHPCITEMRENSDDWVTHLPYVFGLSCVEFDDNVRRPAATVQFKYSIQTRIRSKFAAERRDFDFQFYDCSSSVDPKQRQKCRTHDRPSHKYRRMSVSTTVDLASSPPEVDTDQSERQWKAAASATHVVWFPVGAQVPAKAASGRLPVRKSPPHRRSARVYSSAPSS